MRAVSVVLSVVAAVLVALIAVFFVGGTLSVDARVESAAAGEDSAAFDAVARVFASGAAPEIFQSEVITDASGYALVDLTFTLQNRGLFAAEWVHAELVPTPEDIAVYARSADTFDIPAGGGETLNLKVLSRGTGAGARVLKLEYYVLGMKRTRTISC